MDILTIAILIIVLVVLFQIHNETFYDWFDWMCGCDADEDSEKFDGALQSLYSNDGIQDIHLTVNNDGYGYGHGYGGYWGGYGWGYNPYRYWRGIPWYLPTRNLSRVIYYPYLYDYYTDRYGRYYPYW